MSYVYLKLLTAILESKSDNPTPRSRVLLENLTVAQSVKKYPSYYGTWRFITVFTKAHHWGLPEPDESSNTHNFPSLLSSYLRL